MMAELDSETTEQAPMLSQNLMGQLLKSVRESKSLTVDDVANKLKLSPRQIIALENDEFSALPDAMITRGFIRNYAKFLEMDAEPLLEAFRIKVPTITPHSISLHSANVKIPNHAKRGWLKYIIVSVVFLIATAVWFVFHDFIKQQADHIEKQDAVSQSAQPSDPSSVLPSEPMPEPALPVAERDVGLVTGQEPAETDTAGNTQTATSGTNDSQSSDSATSVKLTETAALVPKPSAETKPNGPVLRFEVAFTGDSWVNVVDGNGKEIFSKLEHEGAKEQIEGQPPLKVTLGNAMASQVLYKNKAIDLAPYTKLNVAKLTLSLE